MMTTARWKTLAVLGGVALALIGWDVYLALAEPSGDTISKTLLAFGQDHPVVPFAFGTLMGHLFWPMRSTR